MITDAAGNRRFFGTYRGVVVDNRDPLGKSRLKLQVPQVLFAATTDWAWSQDTYGVSGSIPPIGQGVWVMFEGGDPSFPVWTGTFGPAEQKSGTSLESLSDVAVSTPTPGDFLTFNATVSEWVNSSAASLNLVRTTDVGSVTGAMIANGSILDADISGGAAISVSKLAASAVTINGTSVTLGGAITVTATPSALSVSTGTIVDGAVTNTKLANSALTVNGVLISLGGSGTITATPTAGSVTSASITAGGIPTTSITNFATTVQGYRLDQFAAPTASVAMNTQTLINLGTPVNPNDAATKAYADSIAQSLDIKASVRVATTGANITLSGSQTIDGITVVSGDRVLVKDQTTASQNGIYVAVPGAWARAADAATSAMVTSGMYTYVSVGTQNASSGFALTTPDPITLGTTALSFVQFSGAGQIIAGAALNKTGNTLDVVGTTNRITVSGSGVDIASTYVGQTSITTLGTISTGTWSATTIAVNKGGTGATTLAAGYLKGNGTSAVSSVSTIPATDITGLGAVSMPSGSITMMGGATIPSGWLYCDGTAVSRTTYSALFTAIGTVYGVGDGSTTFNLPNFKGRVPVGIDATTEFAGAGTTGGEKTHLLTVAEIPSHGHNASGTNVNGYPGHLTAAGGQNAGYTNAGSGDLYIFTQPSLTGGGGAHNNLQPYLTVNFIIKT